MIENVTNISCVSKMYESFAKSFFGGTPMKNRGRAIRSKSSLVPRCGLSASIPCRTYQDYKSAGQLISNSYLIRCTLCCLSLLLISISTAFAQERYTIRYPDAIPLHGEWSFALDPAEVGQQEKWYRDTYPLKPWDKVEVPHCFSVDARYQFYTGTVWYRKTFPWKAEVGKRVILHFDAVYYKCSVWLNNKKIGAHEGGYTPFQIDVTDYLLEGDNFLAVSVNNNTWKRGTVPGAKDEYEEERQTHGQFPGWLNYGGITRPVYLTVEPEVYIKNVKIEPKPDLIKKNATLHVKLSIRQPSSFNATINPVLNVFLDNRKLSLAWKFKTLPTPSAEMIQVEGDATIKSGDLKLWSIDQPVLYQLKSVVLNDTVTTSFGIRTIEIKNTQLLLNGEPVRLGGGNRVIDYPGLGALEPDSVVEKDLRLMKEAGMEFHRLTHYTPSETVLDWADQHGMLIISEAGNWQLTPKQMDNDTIRSNFKNQFTEMIERDWNHPSVIAYSVGNEYESRTPPGQRWTKDMIVFARQIDPTRLFTFATMMLNRLPKNSEDEASQYCDFVSANIYGNHAEVLDHIHKLYPEKPILISEHGARADGSAGEGGQLDYLKKFMSDIRQRPYVVGASWWAFNDYQSRFPGTNKDGYRWWGLVKANRTPRPAYVLHRNEMSPVVIQKKSFTRDDIGKQSLVVTITNRSDFPAYTIRNYVLKAKDYTVTIPELLPGKSMDFAIPVKYQEKKIKVEVVKPTGFSITDTLIDLN
jgi:beta-glucuronidase